MHGALYAKRTETDRTQRTPAQKPTRTKHPLQRAIDPTRLPLYTQAWSNQPPPRLRLSTFEQTNEPPVSADRGQPLPDPLRQKMQTAFGADFSDVRIHEGSEATAIGALAYTRGPHIHFAPGAYHPASPQGQRVMGHELAHVLQQRAGM